MVRPIVSVFGLGYVGLPLAVSFSKKFKTIGFDINAARVEALRQKLDKNGELSAEELSSPDLTFTSKLTDVSQASFHIVAVPTPIDGAKQPDLTPLIKASESLGKILKPGDIVVYESTVYPGATEEVCVPILEKVSGLKGGDDFKVGYSPERINPGDTERTFEKICKVVSGQDAETLEKVAFVYGEVVRAGVYKAQSIRVAEAAKAIENTQRDLNIALMNELAIIFNRLGIQTQDVLNAAGTKWNFLKFTPGLVGGHCIGVDPYYLTYKAQSVGYNSEVILAGRRINDGMGAYVAQKAIKLLCQAGENVRGANVVVLGLTFKENCRDIRNTRVVDIVRELKEYGARVFVHDPLVDEAEAEEEYGIQLTPWSDLPEADAVVVAVSHRQFKELRREDLEKILKPRAVFLDVKGAFNRDFFSPNSELTFWQL